MKTETLQQNTENLVGGWSPYRDLTSEDKVIWNETPKPLGVDYTPFAVSTQIVNGVNYRFKCTASMPPAEVVWEAIVEIYKPINGKPRIIGIIRL
ncbi:hypothetical protein C7448_102336 [Tenacibaculum gallaicum]|uniref:Uncharacterized protein n=1 Tax=Tenacibaculum gallaicum TaxID=561505 RepID=A0A3E0I875_9FLAO|nr:hypothetical protein [Tenacibaculum gallaicum]REH54811.1 hypothetical protein C7448_102336 [Tenacibaculum gallaicum]